MDLFSENGIKRLEENAKFSILRFIGQIVLPFKVWPGVLLYSRFRNYCLKNPFRVDYNQLKIIWKSWTPNADLGDYRYGQWKHIMEMYKRGV